MKANGTGVAEGLTTGVADKRPSGPTEKTSIELVLAFVVTSSLLPSGVKPTWPGEVRKNGGSLFANPSERAEPEIGTRRLPRIQKPCTIPVPPELSTYTSRSRTATLAGNWPPEETMLLSCRRSPCTRNDVTVSLPALTAISVCPPSARASEPWEARWSDSAPGAATPPRPPVGYVPASVRRPSDPRSKTSIWLPLGSFVCTNTTPPRPPWWPCASADWAPTRASAATAARMARAGRIM